MTTSSTEEVPHVHTPDHPDAVKDGSKVGCIGEGNEFRPMTWVSARRGDGRYNTAFTCTRCGEKIVLACMVCGTRQ